MKIVAIIGGKWFVSVKYLKPHRVTFQAMSKSNNTIMKLDKDKATSAVAFQNKAFGRGTNIFKPHVWLLSMETHWCCPDPS